MIFGLAYKQTESVSDDDIEVCILMSKMNKYSSNYGLLLLFYGVFTLDYGRIDKIEKRRTELRKYVLISNLPDDLGDSP